MTTLAPPPPTSAAPSPPAPDGQAGSRIPAAAPDSATSRTLVGLAASALAIVPLKALFSDTGWLVDAWLAMAVVLLPAAALRLRRPAGALDVWPGIVLLVPWLTARYLPAHAWLRIIPTWGTWHDISRLMDALHRTARDDVAPVHTTVAIRLVLCALVGLLAALIDLMAVVGHRGALAGVPMLVVYAVSGAVPRAPVWWVWFCFAAVGFLLLLGLDAGTEIQHWGRRIRGRSRRGAGARVSVTGKRIGVAAVLAAVVLPLFVPSHPRNLLADVFHHHGNGLGGFGAGPGGGSTIDPFVALKGQLTLAAPVKLMTVHIDAPPGAVPFYARVNVLSQFTADGWHVGDHGATQPVGPSTTSVQPLADLGGRTVPMTAQVTITEPQQNAPVFAVPTAVDGAAAGTTWSPSDSLLLGTGVQDGQVLTEHFDQPAPTIAQLRTAPDGAGSVDPSLAEVPAGVPAYVRRLVARLTRGAGDPYDRAAALQRYFTDPRNGFVYDVHSSVGDSGSALVDFLQGKHGFCQQYAAALAVMLRVAGVPSRVVLGYLHPAPDAQGDFTVTTADAHSWVEAYFGGIGWVPFDPTPAAGLADVGRTDLPWARHVPQGAAPVNTDINGPHATGSGSPTNARTTAPSAAGAHDRAANAGGGLGVGELALLALALISAVALVVPALIRVRRRRRRLAAGRRESDAEALWTELSDTAVDLGYVWSPARSPRQVAQWLGRDVGDSRASLQALATAVEQRRYAPDPLAPAAGSPDQHPDGRRLSDQLRQVTRELRRRRDGRTRLGAALWPASLGIFAPWRRWRSRLARRH